MPRTAVTASGAAAVGPYSHGVEPDRRFFLSGQTPLDLDRGARGGGIEEQTRRCWTTWPQCWRAPASASTTSSSCTVFLTDMADFAAMNTAYRGYFAEPFPCAHHHRRRRTALGRCGRDRDGRA